MDFASTFFAVLFLVPHIRGARASAWLALFADLLFKESAIAAARQNLERVRAVAGRC